MRPALLFALAVGLLTAANTPTFTSISRSGRFRATLTASIRAVPINAEHSWTLKLESLGPYPAAILELGLDGGMPGHNHGLPTTPEILPGDRPGQFQIAGLRFHMSGAWELKLVLRDASGSWDQALFSVPVGVAASESVSASTSVWTASERALLRSLSLQSLPPPPSDPTNRVAGDPAAAALGRRLFFEPGLSANGKVSCASCHDPKMYFTDGRRVSAGIAATTRNAPTVVGAAYAPFLFWDGRSDSLWSQALGPLQSPVEMGATRSAVVDFVQSRPSYRRDYEAVFGPLADTAVDRHFANVGKAIAAYERTLGPAESRFDRFVDAVLDNLPVTSAAATLTSAEIAGLKTFLDPKSGCLQCHNGPLFTNQSFHNIGTGTNAAETGDRLDFGRLIGLQALSMDEFNCRGPFRDGDGSCPSLDFLNKDDHRGLLEGAFKVPGLRSVALTAPYMHDGRLASLEAVLDHYRNPPAGNHELRPLALSSGDVANLAAFLRSLTQNTMPSP